MNGTGYWTTSISDVTKEDVYLRGYALQALIGKLPFAGSIVKLTFGGRTSINIHARSAALSDPVSVAMAGSRDVVVSIYIPRGWKSWTAQQNGRRQSSKSNLG